MSVSTDTERIFRIGGYVKRAKLNLRNEREIRAFHRNAIERRFGDFEDGTLVDVYIDITGYKETAKRPEMLRLMRDCADGKVNLIFAETKGYLSANTREFCYWLHFIFNLKERVDIIRSILHCDMNNFYASVECMLDPALKKYPIAVCGSVEERHGIVLAKNYKAKAFDVKTGDAVWQAKQKCKDLVVVPPHYEEYIKYSKLARSVYERYTDQVEPYGMDECWLDISGTESLFGSPEKVANEIRETMKFELGLTISVGVSFNKIFAKLGSDMKKPDAVTVIPKDTFKEKIWGLPAADLLGVGRATQRVLDSYCIRTIGDLANTDPEFLRRRLGKNGVVLWNYANGNDLSLVAKKDFVSPIKSVGHGITTVADLEKPEQVWPVFLELTQDIGHKLRVHGLSAEGVAIHIRDNTLNTRQWQTKIALPNISCVLFNGHNEISPYGTSWA